MFERVLWWILLAIVAAHVLAFLFVVVQRVGYPYELEWMEGSLVDHTSRILRGQDIYTEPGIEHISYLYTPLYYYVSAVMAWFTGIGYLPLRLVALLASLGCAALVGLMVWRETRARSPALVAGGFFLAGFWVVDGWYDLARRVS